ncbi:uncharacterized protein BDZ99DRAFT_577608 [Mytilinidion resinicola]|uniref:Uncharacterized protein n=1 Tax=Mytilinidion resinicola TaxID=574789 RepID=A0A6A6XYM0_9PEZI|nr:uncharacterized protein BDZ99DRAFT_577608 [Mytilinidion resinicola]KAF2801479.1 hypothetical protein BDZ99DRAFT_577608 [Mytilinidion resinicola]
MASKSEPKSSHSTSAPFRLMDLPLELRDIIYAAILCPRLPRKETFGTFLHGSLSPPGSTTIIPLGQAAVSHKIETQILRVSKTVHKEAKAVMLRTNRFVRVTSRGVLLTRIVLDRQLLIWTGRGNELRFNGYMMHHVIQRTCDRGFPQPPFFDFILLASDLDIFLRGLTRSHFVESPCFSDLCEADQVLNLIPFPEEDSPSIGLYESLLRPYRTHLCGFPRFTLECHATLGQGITVEVANNIWDEEQRVVAELRYLEQVSDAYHHAGAWTQSSPIWVALKEKLSSIHIREFWLANLREHEHHSWPTYTAETGFLEQAIQLGNILGSILAVSRLSDLREYDLEALGAGLAAHTTKVLSTERTHLHYYYPCGFFGNCQHRVTVFRATGLDFKILGRSTTSDAEVSTYFSEEVQDLEGTHTF